MGANKPRGVANWDPRGMVGMTHVYDHKTSLNTKYISCGPCGFRKDLEKIHYMSGNS